MGWAYRGDAERATIPSYCIVIEKNHKGRNYAWMIRVVVASCCRRFAARLPRHSRRWVNQGISRLRRHTITADLRSFRLTTVACSGGSALWSDGQTALPVGRRQGNMAVQLAR